MNIWKLPGMPLALATLVAAATAAAWSCKGSDDSGGGANGTGANGTGGSGNSAAHGGTNHGGTNHGGTNPGGFGGGGHGPDCSGGQGGWDANCGMMCHGNSTGDPTPPVDAHGNVDPTAPGVGAHPKHEPASPWHKTVDCAECHPVSPMSLGLDPCVPEHANGITDFKWGQVAKGGQYDMDAKTCTGTWCHGGMGSQDQSGHSTIRTPNWTLLDGTQKACGGACHDLPPAGMHPLTPVACELCHPDVMTHFDQANPESSTWADANLHVDGIIQFQNPVDAGVRGGG
jgi:hypothetical protein